MKQSNSDRKLDVLIQAVEKLVANPVAPVLPVLPIAPVAPVAPIIPPNSGDHDFLLTFSSEVKIKLDNINDNITRLTDGTASKINDHDIRIGKNSDDIITMKTELKVWGVALGVFLTILELATRYIFK